MAKNFLERKKSGNYSKTRLVELQIAAVNENIKSNYNESCIQQKNSKMSYSISRQILSRHYFKTDFFPLKKQALVRFKIIFFAVPRMFVTSRLSVPETLRNLKRICLTVVNESKNSL